MSKVYNRLIKIAKGEPTSKEAEAVNESSSSEKVASLSEEEARMRRLDQLLKR